MEFWRTDIGGIDLDNGEPVIFLTKDGSIHVAFEETRYGYCEEASTCLRNVNYDDFELEDVAAWCYLEDLRRIPLPSGVKGCEMVELRYKREGITTSRLFETQEDADWFKRRTQFNPLFEYEEDEGSHAKE